MKTLDSLLSGLAYGCGKDTRQIFIDKVVYDSRKIEKDCLFICIRGANFDAHDKAPEAVEKGAAAILVERDVDVDGSRIAVVRVADTRYAMAHIAAAYFDHPARKLKTIGVTGTKGKTTTSYLVRNILENAGYRVGLIGSIETITGGEVVPSVNTTPESYLLQEYLAKMVDNGCDAVVMEVSSQGLMMHRTAGFIFDYGIFTNLEPDHIGPNEHKDFADYLSCKARLFRQCRVGIFNGDDEHVREVMEGHTCEVETFGFGRENDLRAEDYTPYRAKGTLGVRFKVRGLLDYELEAELPGRFSVYNVLTAIAICRHFQVGEEDVKRAVKHAKVKGRIEFIRVSDQFSLMIDYAHNAMALESLLGTLRDYADMDREHKGRLVCLFGCGGNRSRDRRYEMGEASGRLADLTILTSDNPRNEEPLDIIADIRTGIERTGGSFIEIPDRKEAIAYAIHNGKRGDIIVLAGKGHEDYQEIKGVKYPMDERLLIREILEEDAGKG